MRFFQDGETARLVFTGSECCHCESDAVVSCSSNVDISGQMTGGFFSSLARATLTGETFFMQTLTSNNSAEAEAVVAPKCPGDVMVLDDLPKAGLVLTKGAFLAASSSVSVKSEIQRNLWNSALSGSGFFLLRLTGQGPVAFAGFGKVFQRELNADEEVSRSALCNQAIALYGGHPTIGGQWGRWGGQRPKSFLPKFGL